MDLFIEKSGIDIYGENGEEMTPYHKLIMENDFSRILDNIRDCRIPTATMQPFSCETVSKFEDMADNPFGGKYNRLLNY